MSDTEENFDDECTQVISHTVRRPSHRTMSAEILFNCLDEYHAAQTIRSGKYGSPNTFKPRIRRVSGNPAAEVPLPEPTMALILEFNSIAAKLVESLGWSLKQPKDK